jgi:hypothetical protein
VTNAFNPYSVTWDTFNTSSGPTFGVMIGEKTLTNPYSGLGNPSCFYINGEELKELSLVKNIPYTFNVFNPGHTFHISTDSIGGNSDNIVTSGQFGAPIDDGTVFFTPNNSHPRELRYVCGIHDYMGYKINIIDGNNSEDLNQLGVGTYTVNVTDSFGCSANASYIVNFNGTCNVTLNLKAFIQGLYIVGGRLQPTLYSLGLSTDPTESDSITVELHDATDPTIIGASTTAILHTDGIAQLQFPGTVIGNSYYIVLRNRNSMETWSKNPILFDNAIMSFDFTN